MVCFSLTLLLGNEIFDIHKQHLLNSDHSHLFVRQGKVVLSKLNCCNSYVLAMFRYRVASTGCI